MEREEFGAGYQRGRDNTIGAMDGWRKDSNWIWKNKLEEGYRKRIYWRDICMEGEQ